MVLLFLIHLFVCLFFAHREHQLLFLENVSEIYSQSTVAELKETYNLVSIQMGLIILEGAKQGTVE